MMQKRSKLFEELVLKSWWTILFFLISFFAYDQAVKRKIYEECKLKKKLEELTLAKEAALESQAELEAEIASQNDEDWIELMLKQKLGLVPEGQIKVYFNSK